MLPRGGVEGLLRWGKKRRGGGGGTGGGSATGAGVEVDLNQFESSMSLSLGDSVVGGVGSEDYSSASAADALPSSRRLPRADRGVRQLPGG